MKVIVFGATGNVGKQLVKLALYNGHQVKAFARNVFTEDLPKDDNLELIQGALFDEKEVYKALKDCDAVLSALGGATDGSDKTRSLGIKNIGKQMEKAGIKRIITVGGAGILEDEYGKLLMDDEEFPPQFIAVSEEHKKAWQFLKESSLQWTMVCPFMIKDGEPTGVFNASIDVAPLLDNTSILSGDLALFMLNEITKNEFVGSRVSLAN